MKIDMYEVVGSFGEDKDAAAKLREEKIKPALKSGESVFLNFSDVSLVTQSFIHALISDILRTNGEGALNLLEFKSCADSVKGIISTVVQYSLDTAPEPEEKGTSQYEMFVRTAREHEADEFEGGFNENPRKITKPIKKPPK